jgi:hypothetical protein
VDEAPPTPAAATARQPRGPRRRRSPSPPWELFGGWLVVGVVATSLALGTVVVVRDAVGDETVGTTLTSSDVSSQLALAESSGVGTAEDPPDLGGPTPDPTPSGPVGATPSTSPTSAAASPTSRPSAASPRPTVKPPRKTEPRRTPSTRPTPTRTPTTSPTASPRPSRTPATRLFASAGGTVVARCAPTAYGWAAFLVSWSPAQDYSVRSVDRGPGRFAGLRFASDARDYEVSVGCSRGVPFQRVEESGGGHAGWRSGGPGR